MASPIVPLSISKLLAKQFEKYFISDIVVFDPELIEDKATFEEPLQFAVGVEDVFVNGIQVLSESNHTGKFPGRFVKGAGYSHSN